MSRNVLESLIIILIALTFGMVLGLPKYQETVSSMGQLEARKTDLKNREDYFAALDKIAGELKNNSENLDKVKSALPMGPSAPSLANYLQSISSQSGLILKNFSYGMQGSRDANTAFAVQEYEIGVTLSGSYPAFKEFLGNLEKSSRLVEIQEIAFTVSRSSMEGAAKVPAETVSPPEGTTPGENNTGGSNLEKVETSQITYEFTLKLKARYY
jgi:Tfp pilus assembly protein PilO